jgi:transcriptional regulator with XRE-family HTH domain
MSDDLLVGLGDRIRKLCKRRGWTQVVMAEKIGMDRSFIADVERGKRNISMLNLDLIAKGFKLSLSRFCLNSKTL